MGSSFRTISIAAIVVAMTSCIPDPLDLEVDQLKPKLVVTSHVDQGTVDILLTRSVGALDANDDTDLFELINEASVSDAVVRIQSNGVTYDLNAFGGAYAISGMPLVAGQTYALYAHSAKDGTVSATTVYPQPISFRDVSVKTTIIGNDSLAQVFYSIDDPSGQNWYIVTAAHVRSGANKEHLNPRIVAKTIDDTGLDGTIIGGDFKIPFIEVQTGDFVTVTLQNVGKDYFDYVKLREDTQFGIAAAVGEPVNYPTNIQGGLGFFALFYIDSHKFTIGE
ncbi:MAG: DUF4249 domain-containing protein [Bacteroidota bacterium]